jgi:hypothetical protein
LRLFDVLINGYQLEVAEADAKMFARSEQASNAANIRHAETTHKKEAAIIEYWKNNIGANVANELAAEQLQKAFPDSSHRTLAKYVSKAKKIPPAGTL